MSQTKEQRVRGRVQDFLDEYMNYEDESVGIYAVYTMDDETVRDIEENINGMTVGNWQEDRFVIECEGVSVIVGFVYDPYQEHGQWEIIG